MEPHADFMGRMGVKLIIGKGGMGDDSLAAFQKYKQAYLQAAPGGAVVLAAGIKDVKTYIGTRTECQKQCGYWKRTSLDLSS